MEATAADRIMDEINREKLCRRWEQKLRERNAEAFLRSFRRKVTATEQFWGMASMVFTAFSFFDDSEDGFGLLEAFQGEKPYMQFERWLKEYYDRQNVSEEREKDEKNMIHFAVKWMREHFSEDISRQSAAEKLGLTETYFSYLFKRETGISFVQMLTEIRISHAKKMIEEGVTDMEEISRSCGYYNKKYFFEVFKRFTGYRITDYQRERKTTR